MSLGAQYPSLFPLALGLGLGAILGSAWTGAAFLILLNWT